jgi:hypothetical protein
MNKIRFLLAIFLLGSLLACDTEDDLIEERLEQNPLPNPSIPTGDPGTADFSNFVALGNSLMAGLMDAALYTNGQNHSIPNLIAQQLVYADGGDFNQPDINAENGFNIGLNDISKPNEATLGRFILKTTPPAGPVPTIPGDPITPYDGDKSTLNNFGVPGARVIDAVTPGYGQFNPLFGRFASSPTASMLGDAVARQPTFFLMWVGNNDVVGYASAGAAGPDGEVNPDAEADPATATVTLTSTNSFTQAYNAAINTFLSVPNSQGVVANIPNILFLPYFRAVPWNPLPLDETVVTIANLSYQQYNGGLDAALSGGYPGLTQEEVTLRKINFQVGQNPVVIADEDLTEIVLPDGEGGTITLPKIRQITSQELLTLAAATVIGTPADPDNAFSIIGVAVPLSDRYVLTMNEIQNILARTATFNQVIANAVANSGGRVALWDANTFFTNLAINGGAVVEGQTLRPDFSPNGLFSTDGIHPNPRGNALAANEIIKVIEDHFDAEIPEVEVLPLRSVIFQ